MLTQELIDKRLKMCTDTYLQNMERYKTNARLAMEFQEEFGKPVGDTWYCDAISSGCIPVKREDLPAIRKIVGRLVVESKSAAYDYERTNELVVVVKAKNKTSKYGGLSFTYRQEYLGRGKCKVVPTSSTSTVWSLSCPSE